MQHPVAAGNRKIYRRQKMGFVLIHIAYFFPKATRCVILFLLHFNKFFKTLLTHSTCRGIFLVNPIDFVDWFKFIHKMWSCSFWTQPQKVVGYHRETHHFREEKSTKNLPPRNTPDSFCRRFTRQNHRCAAWAVFFFFTNKILCGCTILRNSLSVVGSTASKRYFCAWKKQNVVSALRPAFFILYLESCISRLNVILCHDLTLSVSEPDNAAA